MEAILACVKSILKLAEVSEHEERGCNCERLPHALLAHIATKNTVSDRN
jgi:hypothetical protein